jgi:hypothetical protein
MESVQHETSANTGAPTADALPEPQNIRGLQYNLVIPDQWLLLTNDGKVANCAAIRQKAFMGIGELDVSDPENPRLHLGGRNSRNIQTSAARAIGTSVYHNSGPRRLITDMALHLVIRRPWIQSQSWPKQITDKNYKKLPPIILTELGQRAAWAHQLHIINGQHR